MCEGASLALGGSAVPPLRGRRHSGGAHAARAAPVSNPPQEAERKAETAVRDRQRFLAEITNLKVMLHTAM
jgi:hypothetical protein